MCPEAARRAAALLPTDPLAAEPLKQQPMRRWQRWQRSANGNLRNAAGGTALQAHDAKPRCTCLVAIRAALAQFLWWVLSLRVLEKGSDSRVGLALGLASDTCCMSVSAIFETILGQNYLGSPLARGICNPHGQTHSLPCAVASARRDSMMISALRQDMAAVAGCLPSPGGLAPQDPELLGAGQPRKGYASSHSCK
jgi:hypothetical protein